MKTKDIVWQLFKSTGNPAYYSLYRELKNEEEHNKGGFDR